MRDRNGNTTARQRAGHRHTHDLSAAGTPAFSYGPVGIANGQITMTAAESPTPAARSSTSSTGWHRPLISSGWQSSPTWTQTGLTTGSSYTYTVTVRDGRGNVSSPSAPASAVARDDAPPRLAIPVAHWADAALRHHRQLDLA